MSAIYSERRLAVIEPEPDFGNSAEMTTDTETHTGPTCGLTLHPGHNSVLHSVPPQVADRVATPGSGLQPMFYRALEQVEASESMT